MAAINTISNGDNPRALYNQIITALADVMGITDSLQLYALVAKLEVALSTVIIDKDGDGNMTFDDPNVAVQKLQDLVGAVIPTTFLGYMGRPRAGPSTGPVLYANDLYLLPLRPHSGVTATGIYMTAGSAGGSVTVHVAIYDSSGNKLVGSSSPVTIGADQAKTVPFSANYALTAGTDYWAAILNQNNVGSSNGLLGAFRPYIGRFVNTGSFVLPATITAPTSLTLSNAPNFLLTIVGGIV